MKKRVTTASKLPLSSGRWKEVVKSPSTRVTADESMGTSGNGIGLWSSEVVGWWDHQSMKGWMVVEEGVVGGGDVRYRYAMFMYEDHSFAVTSKPVCWMSVNLTDGDLGSAEVSSSYGNIGIRSDLTP